MRTKPLPETFAYGIDIGKKVFHVVAVNREGGVIQRAKFSRETLQSFFDLAPKASIGMEACPGSQWLARRLIEMEHDARSISAVRKAICEVKQDRHGGRCGYCRGGDQADHVLPGRRCLHRREGDLLKRAHRNKLICRLCIESVTGLSDNERD